MYSRDKYARDRVMKSARTLLPHVKDDDIILDVGCFTMEAKKYFPRSVKYIGIDGKPYHRDTKVVDFNHGFEPIPCNHAICLETLEHLLDPEDTLESIHRSLFETGFLILSLPNENTLFHRIRALFGTVDAGCFSSEGKHLHLPSLRQSRAFLTGKFDIVREVYYISPTACGSQQSWVGLILGLFPDEVHQFLADRLPSLFARGFIFLLKKRTSEQPYQTETPQTVS
jgi:SAM-dependent methyltransferase